MSHYYRVEDYGAHDTLNIAIKDVQSLKEHFRRYDRNYKGHKTYIIKGRKAGYYSSSVKPRNPKYIAAIVNADGSTTKVAHHKESR